MLPSSTLPCYQVKDEGNMESSGNLSDKKDSYMFDVTHFTNKLLKKYTQVMNISVRQ